MKRFAAVLVITALCGLPLRADSPQPFFNAAVTNSAINVKAVPGNLYGFAIGNASVAAAICYLQVFNATAANVTLGTTVPALSIPVSPGSATSPGTIALSFSNSPVPFNAAISVAATLTPTGSGACSPTLVVNILFL